MAIDSVTKLVGTLGKCRLLEEPQLAEVTRFQGRFADPRALAKELVQRRWLTAYQVNAVLGGRSAELILGQYVLLERVGEGGMGQVFKARHLKLNRIVALKIIRKEYLANPEAVRRFHREIRASSQLHHANIVHAFDAGQVGDHHFIAMEFVEGVDLAKVLKQSGALPIPVACDYIRQAALGLQHAHEKGMVHRDIKPSNLLVQRTGEGSQSGTKSRWGLVKILDMGLARVPASPTNQNDSAAGTLTQTGAIVGTPDYISPEQARDSRSVDIRADLYSLGCTLYQMLTGQVPFPGGTGMEKVFKHQLDEPPAPEKLRADLPPTLSAIIQKLLAKNAEDRFQLPKDVARALEPFCQAEAQAPLAAVKPGIASDEEPTLAAGPEAAAVPQSKRPTRSHREDATPPDSTAAPQRQRPEAPRSPAAPGRKRRLWLAPVAAVVLLALILGIYSLTRLVRTSDKGSDSPDGGGPNVEVKKTPLDDLNPEKGGPDAERIPDLPPEVVSVLGDPRFRHYGAVTTSAFSHDSRLIASAGADQAIRVWEAGSGRAVTVLREPGLQVHALAFTADNKSVVSWGQDQPVRVWDLATRQVRVRMSPPNLETRVAVLSSDGHNLAYLTKTGAPLVWDIAQNKAAAAPPIPAGCDGGAPPLLAFSPDGRTLLLMSPSPHPDVEAILWDVAAGKIKHRLTLDKEPATNAALAPDGETFACIFSKRLRIWNAARKEKVLSEELQTPAYGLGFAPKGNVLVLRALEQLLVRDLAAGKQRSMNTGQLGYSTNVAISPDGQMIAMGGMNTPRVTVWDLAAGKELSPPSRGHTVGIQAVMFTPDNRTVLSSSSYPEAVCKVWDVTTGQERRTVGRSTPAGGGVHRMNFLLGASADGQYVVMREGNTLVVWDTATGKDTTLTLVDNPAYQLAVLSPDGKFLAVSHGAEQNLRIVRVPSLAVVTTLVRAAGPDNAFQSVVFSGDGQTVATGDRLGQVKLWETATGKERPARTAPLKGVVFYLALSPDGKTAAAGSADSGTKIWNTATGRELASIPHQPMHGFTTFRFAPAGDTLVLWNQQGIRLLDTATGREKGQIPITSNFAVSMAVTPDGKTLATSEANGQLNFWDMANGRRLHQLQMPGWASALAFSSDGRHMVCGNASGTVFILRVPKLQAAAANGSASWDVRPATQINRPTPAPPGQLDEHRKALERLERDLKKVEPEPRP